MGFPGKVVYITKSGLLKQKVMCFSTEASFGSSVILLTIGIISVGKAQEKGQRLLACVPLFFCCQQFLEGVVWMALQHPEYRHWEMAATYGYMTFAQVVWPIMVPLTALSMEKIKKKRKVQALLLAIGICLAIYLGCCLFVYPVKASVVGYHIKYNLEFPLSNSIISGAAYLIPTLIPLLISGIKPMRWLGILLFISFIVTTVLYREYFISVWCYFAALISVVVLLIIVELRKRPAMPNALS